MKRTFNWSSDIPGSMCNHAPPPSVVADSLETCPGVSRCSASRPVWCTQAWNVCYACRDGVIMPRPERGRGRWEVAGCARLRTAGSRAGGCDRRAGDRGDRADGRIRPHRGGCGRCGWCGRRPRGRGGAGRGRLRLLVGHLQEEQKRELLDVVLVGQTVVTQDVTVIPELADDRGGVAHVVTFA